MTNLCTLVPKNCALLIAKNCALLITDYNVSHRQSTLKRY